MARTPAEDAPAAESCLTRDLFERNLRLTKRVAR